MFNKDFFPTPDNVINSMLADLSVGGGCFLEPSAGKGNIVDMLNRKGAAQVYTYEKEPALADHLKGKSTYLGHDFFDCTPEVVSHIDGIIMNPPFSADERHILHAWEIAPEGSRIISLCPTRTLRGHNRKQRRLQTIIEGNGDASRDLGNCFTDAERQTDAEVSIVQLFKPISSEGYDFSGFFMGRGEQKNYREGVVKHDEVRSLVSRYVNAMNCFDTIREANKELGELISPIGLSEDLKVQVGYGDSFTTKEQFGRFLQKRSWKYIFGKMNMQRYVTSGVMKNINKFVEKQTKYPFTMRNIYRMFEIIIGTRTQTMEKALEEAFDQVTKHYHNNRYHLDGWKTNSHYMVNQKIIIPHLVKEAFGGDGLEFRLSHYTRIVDDLNKGLCWLSGQKNNLGSIRKLERKQPDNKLERARWYDWGFFKVKGFKCGTLHIRFKDKNVWEHFNRRVAEIKGYPLPEAI